MDDIELLREYAERGSEAAFTALAERHAGLVYSAALRQTRDAQLAEEVTQAVFIILAKKANAIRKGTILTGWLFRTTRFASCDAVKVQLRRQRREQLAAQMQTTADDNFNWEQIAPFLDEAVADLGAKDRDAVLLRFFENKTLAEVGAALGTNEDAARKRITRAMEKLRHYFSKRGVTLTAAIIAGTVSANSVHAAPATLIKSVTAIAIAKGAAASGSTLTIIKGALKLMAWTKAKTVIVAGAVVLLAAGTTTVTVKEIKKHIANQLLTNSANVDDSYFLVDSRKIFSLPGNILVFRPSHFETERGGMTANHYLPKQESRMVCAGQLFPDILSMVYGISPIRIILPPDSPSGRFDCLVTLPAKTEKEQFDRIKDEIQRQLGLVGHKENREMNVLLLKVKFLNAPGFKPHTGNSASIETKSDEIYANGQTAKVLAYFTEYALKQIVEDDTGLNGRYDYEIDEKLFSGNANPEDIKKILFDQFGLELVPTNMPIEMLVVEKAK
jgi:uncharacterized protein (TIGR03435 family)